MARTTLIREARAALAEEQAKVAPPEFPSPFVFHKRDPITLVELRMRRFSGEIRAKPDWWTKVHDAELVAKWRAEMLEQDRALVEKFWGGEERLEYGRGEKKWPRDVMTDAQLDYVFEQLKYEAEQRDPETGIFATAIPKVYESRSLIPAELKTDFVSGASALESVPEDQKDWHPGSDKQVLDLVHPSLYCLVVGRSHVRTPGAIPTANPVHVLTAEEYTSQRPDFDNYDSWAVSDVYQWLPTDFAVAADGGVKALSYINNLHPIQHRALYPTISSILSRFVPLFERVIADTLSPELPLAVEVDPAMWYAEVPEMKEDEEDDILAPDSEDPYEKWDRESRWPHIPDPAPFSPPSQERRAELKLGGRTVQVIVKLANIVLTPEKPKYEGGSWHVEGMANEKIVATGLYYYACENITQSRLDFRTVVGDGEDGGVYMPYEQSDDKGWYTAYGFGGGDVLNQELGHIVAEEDKCIAFPNVYQHHVDAFELADPTKPGYRKILCFFLVNPFVKIHSTTDVPPQQAEWRVAEMLRVPAMKDLPVELFDMVAEYATSGSMTRAEAEEHRAKLMEERANFVMQHNEEVFEIEFNMCEH